MRKLIQIATLLVMVGCGKTAFHGGSGFFGFGKEETSDQKGAVLKEAPVQPDPENPTTPTPTLPPRSGDDCNPSKSYVVDTFAEPVPVHVAIIGISHPDATPIVHENLASMLAFKRELTIDVIGTLTPTSAQTSIGSQGVGSVGGFTLATASSSGSNALLSYEFAQPLDLKKSGPDATLSFSLESLDTPSGVPMRVKILMRDNINQEISANFTLNESLTPQTLNVPLKQFVAPNFQWDTVKKLALIFNDDAQPDVDFKLTRLSIEGQSKSVCR